LLKPPITSKVLPLSVEKEKSVDWIFLFIASLMEIAWAVGLKYTQGFTRLYPSLFTAGAMVLSFYFFSMALKTIPIGIAYAIWAGIGAFGVAVVGVVFLGEPADLPKILCLALIFIGIMGLKLVAS
jgi:quaternary ammonium compound-resistance protein SugE